MNLIISGHLLQLGNACLFKQYLFWNTCKKTKNCRKSMQFTRRLLTWVDVLLSRTRSGKIQVDNQVDKYVHNYEKRLTFRLSTLQSSLVLIAGRQPKSTTQQVVDCQHFYLPANLMSTNRSTWSKRRLVNFLVEVSQPKYICCCIFVI